MNLFYSQLCEVDGRSDLTDHPIAPNLLFIEYFGKFDSMSYNNPFVYTHALTPLIWLLTRLCLPLLLASAKLTNASQSHTFSASLQSQSRAAAAATVPITRTRTQDEQLDLYREHSTAAGSADDAKLGTRNFHS